MALSEKEIACDGIAAENLLSLLGSVQGWTERLHRTILHFGYVTCQFVKNDLQPQEFYVTLAKFGSFYDPSLRAAVRDAKLKVHSPILARLYEQVFCVVVVVVIAFFLLHVLITSVCILTKTRQSVHCVCTCTRRRDLLNLACSIIKTTKVRQCLAKSPSQKDH